MNIGHSLGNAVINQFYFEDRCKICQVQKVTIDILLFIIYKKLYWK